MLLLSPYLPACNIVGQGKTRTIVPFSETGRNQELSPCTGTCKGVRSMTATHMEHGAKPLGFFLCNSLFPPIKRLRLRAQELTSRTAGGCIKLLW
jgi:hypothetical protein